MEVDRYEAGSPATDATAQRLLQNQTDIGIAIKPLYGDAAGEQLTTLLRDHILTAGDLIAAAKAGDTATVTTTKDTWYANADYDKVHDQILHMGDMLTNGIIAQYPDTFS